MDGAGAGAGTGAAAKQINLQLFAGDGGDQRPSKMDLNVDEEAAGPAAQADAGTKLGWVSGVFIPVLLNIWGVIMFLRLGWVAGQAGLIGGTLVIVLSNIVTGITALSLCAICTNGLVKGGGAYYLISRALGPSYGGAIGILFYIAQAVAVSLYTIGFAETVVDIMKREGGDPFTSSFENDMRVIGVCVNTVLLMVALVGVGWYAKCQIGLLVILMVAMLSVVSGSFATDVPRRSTNEDAGFVGYGDAPSNTGAAYIVDNVTGEKQDFMTVFAVFFPAVTGIMAGANMSGDLKRPSVAIPKGTLSGIGVTFVTYIALLWIVGSASLRCSDTGVDQGPYCNDPQFGTSAFASAVGANTDLGGLYFNRIIMRNLSLWAPLVFAGIFAATLSSALASLVGAPRILQAVARDRLFPWQWFNYFSQLSAPPAGVSEDDDTRPSPEPVRGYVLTYFVASGCVLIGKLDVVAPVISNFFMIAYAFTNYACFAASMSKAPGWRPSFKYFNPYLSLFGSLLCIVIMFLSNWVYGLVSVILAAAIFRYLELHMPDKHWGPANDALRYLRAVKAMGDLSRVKTDRLGHVHVKAYRPQYLVLHTVPYTPNMAFPSAAPASEDGESPRMFSRALPLVSKFFKGRGIMIHGTVVHMPAPEVVPSADGGEETALLDPTSVRLPFMRNRLDIVLPRRKAVMEAIVDALNLNKRQRDLMYTDAVFTSTPREGLGMLMQSSGLGALRPNTVVFEYPTDWWRQSKHTHVSALSWKAKVHDFELMVHDTMRCKLAVAIIRDDTEVWNDGYSKDGQNRVVDVWWLADEGGLAVLIPYLFTQHEQIKGATLRVFTTGVHEHAEPDKTWFAEQRAVKLSSLLNQLRFPAEPFSKKMDPWSVTPQSLAAFERLFPGLITMADVLALKPKELVAAGGADAVDPSAVVPDVNGDGPADGAAAAADAAAAAAASGVGGGEETKTSEDTKPTAGAAAAAGGDSDGAAADGSYPFGSDPAASQSLESEENLRRDTIRLLRQSELIREHSRAADLVFIVCPPTKKGNPVGLYSAWLEVLSQNMPPTVLIRGNGQSVVTPFS